MDQHCCLLFSLPRELRDKIYTYFAWEEHGYLHNPSSGTLRLHDARPIDNALLFTCRQVSQEMRGLALRTNTITFRTQTSLPEAIDIPSDAALFEYLRSRRNAALRVMLGFAHSLATSSVLQTLHERWPDSKAVAGLKSRVERHGTHIMSDGSLQLYLDDAHVDSTQEEDVLEDIVQLLRNHPDFNALTSIGYTKSNWDRWQQQRFLTDEDMKETWEGRNFPEEAEDDFIDEAGLPWYTKANQSSILDWKTKPWEILTREQIEDARKILVGSPEKPHRNENVPGCVRHVHYSAAAVAMHFLQQLPLDTHTYIRHIIIEEDNPAVNEPYTHIHGMKRFWRENPRLKVEQRVDVWKTILIPESWELSPWEMVLKIRIWIIQARALNQQKASIGSYSLVLHGPSASTSQNLSDVMISLAKWQIGNVEFLARVGKEFDKREHCVTEDYSSIIKETVDSAIPVRFEAEYIPGPWDSASILEEQQGVWPLHHSEATEAYVFEEPDEGWEAARHASWAEIDVYDRLAWWNTLVEQL